jgi:hypothetical protein
MPASDLDIARAAHLLIQQHGDEATTRGAAEGGMRSKGDTEGADTWLRIIVPIGTLGEAPTDAWH